MIVNPVVSGGGTAWGEISVGDTKITYELSSPNVKDVLIVLFTADQADSFFVIAEFSSLVYLSSTEDRYYVSDFSENFIEIEYQNEGDAPVAAYVFENTGIPIVEL